MSRTAFESAPSLYRVKQTSAPFLIHSSEQWREHFLRNAQQLIKIPWYHGVYFSQAEREAVADSIAEFQLGESSEGKHLIAQAKRYAEQSGDAAYPHALGLFIAEEHRHARDLGRVLDLAGLARAKWAWPDLVFRWLRHRAGLELSITVLVTAETIAKVYYAALREATRSPVLRRLCDQICADELAHVEFQCERLALLRRGRRAMTMRFFRVAHRIFFAGTCLVVWHKHGRAMRAGGLSLWGYWRANWREFADALDRSDPRCYVTDELQAISEPAEMDTVSPMD